MGLLSRLLGGGNDRPPGHADDDDDDDRLDALLASASRSPARREAFYRALAESTLWIPGSMEPEGLMVRPYDVHGRNLLLLFTSRRQATALRDRPRMVPLPMRSICSMASRFDGVILNYGTPNEKEFTLSELDGLRDGTIFSLLASPRGEPSGAILVGQPKEYPVRLMNDLARAFPTRPEILAAYIGQTMREGEPAAEIVIAIETTMSDAAFEAMLPKLEGLAADAGAGTIRFMRLGDDPVSEYLRRETRAFYEKG